MERGERGEEEPIGEEGERRAEKASSSGPASRLERQLHAAARPDDSLKGAAYQGAMEAVLAIVIAALLGYWADQHFGTAPRWLIVGTIIGFGSFVLRLVRMGKLAARASAESEAAGQAPRAGDAAARRRERSWAGDQSAAEEQVSWLGVLEEAKTEREREEEEREREKERREPPQAGRERDEQG